jgi:stearoyl-CoA desaturase (delta-9 desaturase)
LDLAIFAVLYVISGFGVTIGYHRLLTHRSFDAPAPVRAALAIAGSTAVQGAPIHWVADHRKHHAFADVDGDPHSPHTHGGEGWRAVLGGLWHAHTGWLFTRERSTRRASSLPISSRTRRSAGPTAGSPPGRCSASSSRSCSATASRAAACTPA